MKDIEVSYILTATFKNDKGGVRHMFMICHTPKDNILRKKIEQHIMDMEEIKEKKKILNENAINFSIVGETVIKVNKAYFEILEDYKLPDLVLDKFNTTLEPREGTTLWDFLYKFSQDIKLNIDGEIVELWELEHTDFSHLKYKNKVVVSIDASKSDIVLSDGVSIVVPEEVPICFNHKEIEINGDRYRMCEANHNLFMYDPFELVDMGPELLIRNEIYKQHQIYGMLNAIYEKLEDRKEYHIRHTTSHMYTSVEGYKEIIDIFKESIKDMAQDELSRIYSEISDLKFKQFIIIFMLKFHEAVGNHAG